MPSLTPSVRSERTYSDEEIVELLEKAEALGFSTAQGSELEHLTLAQIDNLVHTVQ